MHVDGEFSRWIFHGERLKCILCINGHEPSLWQCKLGVFIRWSYAKTTGAIVLEIDALYLWKTTMSSIVGNEASTQFSVRNGVRQGGTSSAILFAVYIEGMIDQLRKSKIGCSIFGQYLGVQSFADDIYLLSPSRSGLQAMVNICNDYISRRNLKFGTDPNPKKSKTKCMIYGRKI